MDNRMMLSWWGAGSPARPSRSSRAPAEWGVTLASHPYAGPQVCPLPAAGPLPATGLSLFTAFRLKSLCSGHEQERILQDEKGVHTDLYHI